MKKAKRFAALFLSGLLAVGSLAGCGRNYDPGDVEDPAGMGTADNLEAADAARMVSLYRTAQAGSGLPAGQDERVQDALNRAFNRHTSGDITTLCRVLQKTLRKAGFDDAEVYISPATAVASGAKTACSLVMLKTSPEHFDLDAFMMPQYMSVMREDTVGYGTRSLYYSIEDAGDGEAAYALLLVCER